MNQLENYVYKVQEDLHNIPEPAFSEYKTSAYIAKQLRDLGYEVEENIASTGIKAVKRGKREHPCIGIRADMDCIIHEKENETYFRHSCGHDAHSSIALGLATYFSDKMSQFEGSIAFIFQPAEEIGVGAKTMVEEGALEGIDYLLGYHLRTNHECEFGKMSPALMHSAASSIKGKVTGMTAHGGRPHLGVNVIDVLTSLLTNTALIRYDPLSSSSIKFTQLSAGKGSINVIPDYGTFGIDIRSGNNRELKAILKKIEDNIQYTAEMHNAKITYSISDGVPAPQYDADLVFEAEKAISEELGKENCVAPIYTPGGEDFHYYSTLTDIKTAYLAIGADVAPGLHDPNMTFNKQSLIIAVRVLTRLIQNIFKQNK
jgi:amidohydrolase